MAEARSPCLASRGATNHVARSRSAARRASETEHAVRHLIAEIDDLRKLNRSTAEHACVYLDLVQRVGWKPAHLLDMQAALRRDLLWVESRLRTVRGRAKALRRRLAARAKRDPASRDSVLKHMATLVVRERVLVLRRLLLRQIADAFAWLVLRLDARLILPLYREQTHQLPRGEGLGGPAELARRAMHSGEFLVIENDLTRCLGVGDLTVVFAARRWKHPISYEVKSSARPAWRLGAELQIEAIAAVSDDPADVELHERFTAATGFGDLPATMRSREQPAQTAEQLSAAELVRAAKGVVGQRLSGPSRLAWKTLGTVLTRALADGASYDIAERGVVFMAIRSIEDQAPEAVSKDLFEKVRDLPGFGSECKIATSVDLRHNDEWSALALPIVLWPVSQAVRAALLCGELFLACVVRPDAWREAMKSEGLEFTEERRGWTVTGPSKATHIDVLEAGKLTLGVAFSGVSPREIAAGLAASLNGETEKREEG